MRNYKEGDVVRLKSGGPDMVVTVCCYLGENSQWACDVVWMAGNNELQSATLPEVCLVMAEEKNERPFSVGDMVFNTKSKKFGCVFRVHPDNLMVAEEGSGFTNSWKISQTEHAN